ncbi:MAG: M48 family metalloprotease, partial [Thermodesulfovibrionales bacterium]|nr:M48 family metalloprotease [Thermodesulfovibrionales bacterium]
PVRKGPGWYYPVLYELKRGDTLEILEKSGLWYKVKGASGQAGYASARSINYSAGGTGGQGSLSKGSRIQAGRSGTSRPMMVAALRGVADMGLFPRKYAEKHGLDPAEIEALMESPFGVEEYRSFKEPLSPTGGDPGGLADADIPEADREVGIAITMRLLSVMPPSRDPRLRKYVSMVGSAVQENTPVYDVPFVFIVLQSKKVNSFSAPGGFVFITTGALETMESEAELAGVLSHEVVHVLMRHGMKELDRQDTRIKSAGMMDDLDNELDLRGMDKGDEQVMADMEDMADQMFEQMVGGRKIDDEDQADKIGTRLLSTTGYAPAGLREFIVKTSKVVTGEELKTYAYRDADRRASAIDRLIEKSGLGKGEVLRERFERYVP